MTLYDISLPLGATLAVWPGDTPYAFRLAWQRSAGETVNVGAITTTVHAGTHVDAPFHFGDGGATIDQLRLDPFLGPAVVLDVSGRPGIGVERFAGIDLSPTPRVLLRTGAWTDHARFPESIPVMEADVPAFLAAQGVVLVGLDVPSVDALDSADLPRHHALARHGVHILESLDLAAVPPGQYELIALPLRLVGADASPVRAVLRRGPV